MYRCASFDIGKKNFSFCVEEFNTDELLKLTLELNKIPEKNRYNPDGTCTEKMQNLLKKVYSNGKIILHKNVNLTLTVPSIKKGEKKEKKNFVHPEIYHNMIDVLEEHVSYWDTCHTFVIEEQMFFKKVINPMAVKLGQHCYSYFTFRYGRFKTVIEFPATNKTQILGAKKDEAETKTKKGKIKYVAVDKTKRKKWAVEKAKEILHIRNEDEILFEMMKNRKQDDLGDVICQLQSFKFLAFVKREL